jgi:valyl-tRNA synthetase
MSVEEGLYQWWLEGKYFEATGDAKYLPSSHH